VLRSYVRATNVLASRPFNFVTGAEDDMTQMMRYGMPKLFIVTVASQRSKIIVSVTSVTVNSVVIVPSH